MTTRTLDRVDPGDLAEAKVASNRVIRLSIGLTAFAATALAFCFLFFHGGMLLAIGLLFELISLVGALTRGEGFGAMLMLPAVVVVSGLLLAFRLLDVAFRALARTPFPSVGAVLRCCVISPTTVAAAAIAVGVFTGSVVR